MKVIRAIANNNIVLGTIGIDSQSGGYPYVRDPSAVPVNIFDPDGYFNDYVLKSELTEMASGALLAPMQIRIFLSEYKKLVPPSKDGVIKITFQTIEIDHSDLLNIKSKLLTEVMVKLKEADTWKTRDQAFYKSWRSVPCAV